MASNLITNSSETNENKLYTYLSKDTQYFSGGNASIHIHGIKVEECYDLQYTYRETKEPVYGYRSRYYSEIIPGTVIVTGQFTINYIHDAYLYSILQKATKLGDNENNTGSEFDNANPMAIKREDMFDAIDKQFKANLEAYRKYKDEATVASYSIEELEAKISALESKIVDYGQIINEIDGENGLTSTSPRQQIQKEAAKEENALKDSWWWGGGANDTRSKDAEKKIDNYDQGLKAYQNNKNAINTYSDGSGINIEGLDVEINIEINTLLSNPNTRAEGLSKFTAANEAYKAKLDYDVGPNLFTGGVLGNDDARDILKIRQEATNEESKLDENRRYYQDLYDKGNEELSKLKDELAEKEKQQKELQNKKADKKDNIDNLKLKQENRLAVLKYKLDEKINKSNERMRPEDIYTPFDIKIKYNALTHKIIRGVQLTGHAHLVGVGGEPIREQYTFIAKMIDNLE